MMHAAEIPSLTFRQVERLWKIADRCKAVHFRNHGDLCRSCQAAWDREFARAFSPKTDRVKARK